MHIIENINKYYKHNKYIPLLLNIMIPILFHCRNSEVSFLTVWFMVLFYQSLNYISIHKNGEALFARKNPCMTYILNRDRKSSL
jgi:hypothetical protein